MMTEKQWSIYMRIVVEGKSNSSIAKDLGLSRDTVKKMVSEILEMHACKSRIMLILNHYGKPKEKQLPHIRVR